MGLAPQRRATRYVPGTTENRFVSHSAIENPAALAVKGPTTRIQADLYK